VTVALFGVQIKAEGITLFQIGGAADKFPDSQLWPLQIGQNRDRAAGFGLDLADDVVPGAVIFVAAVAHVQAEHIGPGVKQGADHVMVARMTGPNRGHDLYVVEGVSWCLVLRSVSLQVVGRANLWPKMSHRATGTSRRPDVNLCDLDK